MGHKLFDLTGRTAVVIGGTSGIGLAMAVGLAEAGANVVASSRRQEQVAEAAAKIEAGGARHCGLPPTWETVQAFSRCAMGC
jgi:NAD(P)-dependent dehydrogenase (short-subunit alcohol dehydrogenase family)